MTTKDDAGLSAARRHSDVFTWLSWTVDASPAAQPSIDLDLAAVKAVTADVARAGLAV